MQNPQPVVCTLIRPQFNAITFEAFLHLLLRNRCRGKRMAAILDNAKYHHARVLQPWLEKKLSYHVTLSASVQSRSQSD
ncbi:MAG TPA: hypothetical protein DCP92_22485 [Nitrospiraceae bacterium]|nr:hypothetical protein [Nitrospiraceae bacterium]